MTKKIKITLFTLGIMFFCALGAGGFWAAYVHKCAFVPLGKTQDKVLFVIPKGSTVKNVCLKLEKNGLIRSGKVLLWYLRHKGVDGPVKAGEYRLSPSQSAWEIFREITEGKRQVLHRITIAEGLNLKQVAGIVQKKLGIDKKVFLKLCYNIEFIRSLGIEKAKSLEGYLFPETYFFTKNVSAENVITSMVKRFNSLIKPEYLSRARELGFSFHEVLTLASIIEKETATPSERPLISKVYHERLKRRMRLQCDPTVIYGLEEFDGNLTRKDLKTASPYNTYIIKGLPPGPIANPGIDSIKAALYPAKKKALYFVSKNNGTHYFSYTLKEHNRAVRKYQKLPHRKKSIKK